MPLKDVFVRFAVITSEHSNYETRSLPMISPENEIMFFYYADVNPGGFVLREIGDSAFRDLQSSIITVREPLDLFTAAELDELTEFRETKILTGSEALDNVERYYEIHEEIVQMGIENASDHQLREYLDMFGRIVPKSNLRKAYFRIGQPMFRYITKRIGK